MIEKICLEASISSGCQCKLESNYHLLSWGILFDWTVFRVEQEASVEVVQYLSDSLSSEDFIHSIRQTICFYNVIIEIIYRRNLPFKIKSNRFLHPKSVYEPSDVLITNTVCVLAVSEMMTQLYLCVCVCVTAATITLHCITTNPHAGNRWATTGSLGLTHLIIFTLQSSCFSCTFRWWDD